jgi:RNA polymerase sigma factor (sigma-70 family)
MVLVDRAVPAADAGRHARFRLSTTDADDVVQTVWLRLFQHLSAIRDPEALPGWIVTVARRESMAVIAANRRAVPTDLTAELHLFPVYGDDLATELLRDEVHQVVRDALGVLKERQRALMLSIFDSGEHSYRSISEEFGISVGSIGPTRNRCLQKLRQSPAILRYADDPAPIARSA